MNQHIDLVAFNKGEPAESNTLGYYLDWTVAIWYSDQVFICHWEKMQEASLSDIFRLFSPWTPLRSFLFTRATTAPKTESANYFDYFNYISLKYFGGVRNNYITDAIYLFNDSSIDRL